jgi:acyl-CoA synthetase (NDP forming)
MIRKPIAVASLDFLENIAKDYQILLRNGIPLYPDPRRAARSLAQYAAYGAFVRSPGPLEAGIHSESA